MHGEPLSPWTDAEHIAGSLAEPELFSAIFERHASAVYKFLTRQVNHQAADDLLAETFVAAFRSRGRYDASYPNARGWLFGIAVNVARHHHRTTIRQRMLRVRVGSQMESEPDEEANAVDRLVAGATRELVATALDDLKPLHREVLLLAAFELEYEDIARALQVPVGTVRSRLSRARKQMRELVGPGGQYEVMPSEATAPLTPTRQTGDGNG
jgi:RNA polymerase sigma-70 factor (ECF subfamily)